MKHRFFYGTKPSVNSYSPKDFSQKDYECVLVFQTTHGAPVVVSRHKSLDIWQCNDKFKGDHRCSTPHLYEKDIKKLFILAFGKLMADREHILEDIQLAQTSLCDCTELDAQKTALAEDMESISELIRQCIEENSTKVQNQAEYLERYERHTRRYEKIKQRYEAIEAERQRRKEQNDRIIAFAATLDDQKEIPIEFDDDLWLAAVDHVTVNSNETVTFTFKSGIEITEQM